MSELESTDSYLTFDDILEAVQESRRGRWFLREFETRIQKRESTNLMQAIERLERRMESLTARFSTPTELEKVRGAIGSARADLKRLTNNRGQLSEEGRLFADLADKARKSLPANDDSREKIVRSLQLVDEIDRAMDGLATTSDRYFMADSQVFENAIPQTTSPEIEVPSKGASLVVRRIEPSEPTQEAAIEDRPLGEPARASEHKVEHPRITIIRRSAEEMPEVAIPEPEGTVSAA